MKKKLLLVIGLAVILAGCNIVKTYQNLTRLQFKVGKIENVKVSNISVSNKSKLSDFNPLDILSLTSKVAKGEFPVSMTVNIDAKNPSEGQGGGVSDNTITLKSFPWKLYIDDVETISGNISQPIYVPSKGENVIIPIEVSIDLMKFFKQQGLDKMVNLVLALGGSNKSSSKVKFVVRPTIGTPIGDFRYPNDITIVDYKFN
ncbi:MAG: lipoprotein [bacterium]